MQSYANPIHDPNSCRSVQKHPLSHSRKSFAIFLSSASRGPRYNGCHIAGEILTLSKQKCLVFFRPLHNYVYMKHHCASKQVKFVYQAAACCLWFDRQLQVGHKVGPDAGLDSECSHVKLMSGPTLCPRNRTGRRT
jgi:hypothetical protein